MQKLIETKRKELLINGIYKIINIIDGKFYIGSCSSKTLLYERLLHHKYDLLNKKHGNILLQRAVNKYGIENFYYEILEICHPDECLIKEQYYLDNLNPNYNILKIAGNSSGKKCKKKTKKKISEANKKFWSKKENKDRMKLAFKDRVHIKVRKKGYKNPSYKLSEEGRLKLQEKQRKKVLNKDTNEIYSSLTNAASKLNANIGYLSRVLNEKRKSKYNLEWV